MKTLRQVFLILIELSVSLTAAAIDPGKGYRGFVDANLDLTFNQSGAPGKTTAYYGVSTSHGYQFNDHYYLGAGVMIEYHNRLYHNYGFNFPIYLHTRTDWRLGRFPLYGDVRVGGVIFGEYRFYLSPTVGYRLNLGGKSNLNFGIGMTFRGYGWSDQKTLHPQLAVRAGIDF